MHLTVFVHLTHIGESVNQIAKGKTNEFKSITEVVALSYIVGFVFLD